MKSVWLGNQGIDIANGYFTDEEKWCENWNSKYEYLHDIYWVLSFTGHCSDLNKVLLVGLQLPEKYKENFDEGPSSRSGDIVSVRGWYLPGEHLNVCPNFCQTLKWNDQNLMYFVIYLPKFSSFFLAFARISMVFQLLVGFFLGGEGSFPLPLLPVSYGYGRHCWRHLVTLLRKDVLHCLSAEDFSARFLIREVKIDIYGSH